MPDIVKQVKLDTSFMPTISVCMIVKDEVINLEKLLPIVYKTVDEIVIVDTGSTDSTVEIAKKYTDKVFSVVWDDSFSKARNESLKHATKDYILWLDADDMISKQDIARIRFHLMKFPDTAVFMDLVDRKGNMEKRAKQLRVFPNNRGIEFRGRVHEQVSFSIEEKGIKYSESSIPVYHFGYSSKEDIIKKLNRNLYLLFRDFGEDSDNFLNNLNISKTYLGLGKVQDALFYIKKCIELFEKNNTTIDKEHAFLAYHMYYMVCRQTGELDKILELFIKNKENFKDINLYNMSMGELFFIFRRYRDSYEALSSLEEKNESLLSVIPIDMKNMAKILYNILLISSLHVGDFKTAENCVKRLTNDRDFSIKR